MIKVQKLNVIKEIDEKYEHEMSKKGYIRIGGGTDQAPVFRMPDANNADISIMANESVRRSPGRPPNPKT